MAFLMILYIFMKLIFFSSKKERFAICPRCSSQEQKRHLKCKNQAEEMKIEKKKKIKFISISF